MLPGYGAINWYASNGHSVYRRRLLVEHKTMISRITSSASFFVRRSLIAVSCLSSISRAMSHNTIRGANGIITVSPRDESKLNGLMVICHGLGDTAEGFVDVAEVSITPLDTLMCII